MRQSDFDKLQEAYTLRGIMLHQLHERVDLLEKENARLSELLKLQQNSLFGKKSETSNSLNLPTVIEVVDGPPTTVVTSHVRIIPPRGSRQLDTSNLPKYSIVHELPDAEKNCSCCGGILHIIGQEKSEQLEIIPVQYCVIEHIRLKYGVSPQ